jgi:hypothetical protein
VAYTCDIYPDLEVVLIRSDGPEWSATDILDSAADIVSDDRFRPGFDWIYDLRTVRRTVIGLTEMDRILKQFEDYRASGRVDSSSASVVVSAREDELHFTPTLYKHRADRPDALFEVVATMKEARQSLGVEKAAWNAVLNS